MASEVALGTGIHVSQLFRWRKDLCDRVDSDPAQLVPIEIVPVAAPSAVESTPLSAAAGRRRRRGGIIEIEVSGALTAPSLRKPGGAR
jgi:transposase